LQFGFKEVPDVSAVFTMLQAMTVSHSVFVPALDASKALDKVSRDTLFIKLSSLT